jgi:hypothetical protein
MHRPALRHAREAAEAPLMPTIVPAVDEAHMKHLLSYVDDLRQEIEDGDILGFVCCTVRRDRQTGVFKTDQIDDKVVIGALFMAATRMATTGWEDD